jgi:hypothetical protein
VEAKSNADFELIPNVSMMLNYLKDAAQVKALAEFWIKDQQFMHKSSLIKLDNAEGVIVVKSALDFDWKLFSVNFSSQMELLWFFNVTLSVGKIFFSTTLHSSLGSTLRFSVPLKAYRVQRRKALRWILIPEVLVMAEFQNPKSLWETVQMRVIDVSKKGMAFYIPEGDQTSYEKGTLLRDFRFTLRSAAHTVLAQVVQCRQVPSFEGRKVCRVSVIFHKMSEKDSERLARLIVEETKHLMEALS